MQQINEFWSEYDHWTVRHQLEKLMTLRCLSHAGLTERETYVLIMRLFGPNTFVELSEELGLTRPEIRAVEATAAMKIMGVKLVIEL